MSQYVIEIAKNPIKGKRGYRRININANHEKRKEYDMPAYYFPNGKWIYFLQINESSKKIEETWHKMKRMDVLQKRS